VIDELKEEWIVNKVGGRFKLSTLIQKRMVALQQGARPLVDIRGGHESANRMAVVIEEIIQDKIYLDASNEVQSRDPSAAEMARRAMLGDISSSMGDD
jgi:DNA-directed RNA polymerase subunit omega